MRRCNAIEKYRVIAVMMAVLVPTVCTVGQGLSLEDFFVWTTTDSIHTQLVIRNNTGDAVKKVVARQTVVEADGEIFCEVKPVEFSLAPFASATVELSGVNLSPWLWSPEEPYLYEVKTTVEAGKERIVDDKRRTGFRTFEIRGSHFYLNGKPYYLRALSQWPPDRVQGLNGKTAPEVWNDEEFIKKFFKKMKETHVNAGRIGGDELWAKYADEMGILNICGSYSGAGATDVSAMEDNKESFTASIKQMRNHVSTVFYTLANELSWNANPAFLPLAKRNCVLAKRLDPTRPVIGNAGFGKGLCGDIDDVHDYTGWYGGSITAFDSFEKDYQVRMVTDMPVTFTECIGTYTNNSDGSFVLEESKLLCNAMRLVGKGENFAADCLWYQSLITKEMMEAMRRARGINNRICGPMPFSEYWFWDVPNKDFRAKPAVTALQKAYSPVLLSLRCWKRHVTAGEALAGMLYVVNDDMVLGDLADAKVIAAIVQKERVLTSQEIDIPKVEYYGTVKLPFAMAIPDTVEAGQAKLILKLIHPKAVSIENEVEIYVAPKGFLAANNGHEFALYDPVGTTAKLFENIGIKFRKVEQLKILKEDVPLVIGAGSADSNLATQADDLWAFVRKGGRVLVLEQRPTSPDDTIWLLPKGVKLARHQELFVNIERLSHKLSEGLRHHDFFMWNDIGEGEINCNLFNFAFDIRPANAAMLDNTAILANAGKMLIHPVVMEHFAGDGSVVYSQFECVARSANDPVAAKVLLNLLEYQYSSEHFFAPEVGWEVRFADFISEKGIFPAPMKQGILTNTHNYGQTSYNGSVERPDGVRVVGEQLFQNGLGYLEQVNKENKEEKGFFYLRHPNGAKSFTLIAKNPVKEPLWFRLYVNDQSAGAKVTIQPMTTTEVGPWSLAGKSKRDMKITLEVPRDMEGREYITTAEYFAKVRVIRELVFTGLKFQK